MKNFNQFSHEQWTRFMNAMSYSIRKIKVTKPCLSHQSVVYRLPRNYEEVRNAILLI